MSSIVDIFVTRIVSIAEHLKERSTTHKYLQQFLRHEEERLMRLGRELCVATEVSPEEEANPQKTSAEVRKKLKEGHTKSWKEKAQHGYLFRRQEAQPRYDKETTNSWLRDRFMLSHIEGLSVLYKSRR